MPNQDLPLVISFYTDNWEYPRHAQDLIRDCQRLGLDHHLEPRADTGDYHKNTALKSFFVRDMLEKFKRPVLWVDVDGSILQRPNFLVNSNTKDYDLAARRYTRPGFRAWHVATLFFNYTPNARSFADTWCQECSTGTDERAFEAAWLIHQSRLRVLNLPSSYFVLLNKPSDPYLPDTVIAHRLSASPSKLQKKLQARKRPSN